MQLERIAKENPDSVSTAELLEKLKTTENKLERWQSIRRKGKKNKLIIYKQVFESDNHLTILNVLNGT